MGSYLGGCGPYRMYMCVFMEHSLNFLRIWKISGKDMSFLHYLRKLVSTVLGNFEQNC
jgi:hypothetical protein